MKHIKFTIQFVVLIAAIPVLMFAELTHGTKTKPAEDLQKETICCKTSSAADSIMPFTQAVLN